MRNFFRMLFYAFPLFYVFVFAILSAPCYAEDGKSADSKWKISSVYSKYGYSDWREVALGPATASSTIYPGSAPVAEEHQVMRERGPLYAVGVEGTLTLRREYVFDWTAEVFGGVMYYDGAEMLTQKPRKTVQAYTGTKETLTFNVKESWITAKCAVNPFVGLEHRSLFKTTGPELWNVFSVRVGLRRTYRADSGVEYFATASVNAPFLTVNHAFYLPIGYADRDHFPSNHASFAAELGVKFPKGKTISLSYEPYECGASKPVTTYKPFGNETNVFYQPATKVHQVWLKIGKRF